MSATIIPRDYQTRDSQRILAGLRVRDSVAYTAPTGSGKTVVGQMVAAHFQDTIVLSPTRLLAEQWAATGLRSMTIQRALGNMARGMWVDPELIIIDEAHHVSHNSYELFAMMTHAKILGLSATYYRTKDTEGFTDVFSALVPGPTRSELIDAGYVMPIEIHIPGLDAPWDGEDLGLPFHLQWESNHLAAKAEAVVEWALPFLPGRLTLGYANSIAQCRLLARRFRAQGIPTVVVTGEDRRGLGPVGRYVPGKTLLVFTVALISEGVDLPNCSQILLTRNIASHVTYHQIVGRATRPGLDVQARLLDYGGSSFLVGHPDMGISSTLSARSDEFVIQCPECKADVTGDVCYACGWERPHDEPVGAQRPQERCLVCRKPVTEGEQCPRCTGVSLYRPSDTEARPEQFTVAGLTFVRRGPQEPEHNQYVGQSGDVTFGMDVSTCQGSVDGRSLRAKSRKTLVSSIIRAVSAAALRAD